MKKIRLKIKKVIRKMSQLVNYEENVSGYPSINPWAYSCMFWGGTY